MNFLNKTSKNSADRDINKVIKLYNKGFYEEALFRMEKLSNQNKYLNIIFIPHIEKCKRIVNKNKTQDDIIHFKNETILKNFGWINKIKYFSGIICFISFYILFRNEDNSYSENIFNQSYLIWSLLFFLILTVIIHLFMRKFSATIGSVRCKYCGAYTKWISPNEPTFGFAENNKCEHCKRMYPIPDYYWDSWDGLEYMEERRSVPEKIFYEELKNLKSVFNLEYNEWKISTK